MEMSWHGGATPLFTTVTETPFASAFTSVATSSGPHSRAADRKRSGVAKGPRGESFAITNVMWYFAAACAHVVP